MCTMLCISILDITYESYIECLVVVVVVVPRHFPQIVHFVLHRLLCRFTRENLPEVPWCAPKEWQAFCIKYVSFFDFQIPISEGLARLLRQPWELALNFHRLSIRQNLMVSTTPLRLRHFALQLEVGLPPTSFNTGRQDLHTYWSQN